MVLPEIISKEPLGPVVRQGDDEWFNIVRWSLYAMVNAEELGVTSENVDQMAASSKDPNILRLLGQEGIKAKGWGWKTTGLSISSNRLATMVKYSSATWVRAALKKIARGINQLWNKGHSVRTTDPLAAPALWHNSHHHALLQGWMISNQPCGLMYDPAGYGSNMAVKRQPNDAPAKAAFGGGRSSARQFSGSAGAGCRLCR